MSDFSLFFNLSRLMEARVQKTDIIDLYILMSMPNLSDQALAFISRATTNRAISNIKSELQTIVLREFRHVDETLAYQQTVLMKQPLHGPKSSKRWIANSFGEESGVGLESFKIGLKLADTLLFETFGEENSPLYDEGELDIYTFERKTHLPWTMNVISRAFKNWEWMPTYGGKEWAIIAKEVGKFLRTSVDDIGGQMKQLDRLVDFVHHSGTLPSKFKGRFWMQFILDLKQHSTNIRELIPFASPDVQKLFSSPDWRMSMRTQPGFGAHEADDVIIKLFKQYIDFIMSPDAEGSPKYITLRRQNDSDHQAGPLRSLISHYGARRIINALQKAKETDHELLASLKFFKLYLKKYLRTNNGKSIIDSPAMHTIVDNDALEIFKYIISPKV